MKQFTHHMQQGLSIRVSSILLLLIPILNVSLQMVSENRFFLGPEGMVTLAGGGLFAGFCGLIILTMLVYPKRKLLFKFLISFVSILVPTLFVIIDTKNFVLQTLIVLISLFYLLFFLFYDEPVGYEPSRFAHSLIQHNWMLLFLVVFSTKYKLLWVVWNRYFILVYLLLYLLYYLFCGFHLLKVINFRNGAGILLAGAAVVASFFLFESINYLFTLILLLILLYLPFHVIQYDKLVVNLLFENPYKLLIISFSAIVIVGAFLLSMPFSAVSGASISFIDGLFTATSAVCVTGLTVLDTYRDFSLIGQVIILVLIQAGGLGIVTIMTFVSMALGQSIGVTREFVVGEIVGSKRPKMVYDLIRFIMLITFAVELLGAGLLSLGFYLEEGNGLQSLWKGIFHAISAFCNAGFALQGDSLIMYNRSFLIPGTVALLVVIGGLGFPVISYLYHSLVTKAESRTMPIMVKLSIFMTGCLIGGGYLFFLLSEYSHGLRELPAVFKHSNALFLSITARTAGFNAIDMTRLTEGSILILLILMFIGAGSCSTAGGIKITTLGVLFAAIDSFIKGRAKTILFQKRLPSLLVNRAIVLFFTSLILVFFITVVLLTSQKLALPETLFEVISAFGTVGLSLGATLKLDDFGKFLIVIVMFIGRVNILTFISLFITTKTSAIRYPEESMMIG